MNGSEMAVKGQSALFSDKLYCTDCMELFGQLPDGCVSMILTDPPYGIQYQNNFTHHPHPLIAGDSGIDYERFAQESYRILRDNAHAYFFTRFDCYPHHYNCLQRAGFSIKKLYGGGKGKHRRDWGFARELRQQCRMDSVLPKRAADIPIDNAAGKSEEGGDTVPSGRKSQQAVQDPV